MRIVATSLKRGDFSPAAFNPQASVYAVEKTRTSTGLPPQAPQACASTIPPRPPGQAAGYTGCATPLQLPPVRRKQGFRIEEVLGPRSTMGLSDEHGVPMDHRANPLASATGGACPRALDQAVDPEAGKGGCFHLLHPLPDPPPLSREREFRHQCGLDCASPGCLAEPHSGGFRQPTAVLGNPLPQWPQSPCPLPPSGVSPRG